MRMVINYRALNKITVKNRTALPNIREILDRLKRAKYYSRLDLQLGFHQLLLTDDSCKKTAFRTKYDH